MRPTTLLLLATCGCSFMFQTRPPDLGSKPSYPIDCTTHVVAPVFDTIGGVLFGLTAVGIASGDCNGGNSCTSGDKAAAVALAGGIALAYAVSAVSGVHAAERCSYLQNLSRQCVGGSEAACATFNWDPRKQYKIRAEDAVRPAPPKPPEGECEHDSDCDRGTCISGFCR